MAYFLDTDVTYLKGVGPKWGDRLHRLGFRTLQDLIEYYPRAYEDRRSQRTIASLKEGERVFVCGEIIRIQGGGPFGPGSRYRILTIRDHTGFLFCKYFRVPFRTYFEKFHTGQKVLAFGQVRIFQGRREFHHPELILLNEVKEEEQFLGLLPIYSEGEGLSSKKVHQWILGALDFLKSNPDFPKMHEAFEVLPDWLTKKYQLEARFEALYKLHQPDPNDFESLNQFKSKAHRRLIFDEFFWLELYLLFKKRTLQQTTGFAIHLQEEGQERLAQFFKNLHFSLTNDQQQALKEILNDFKSGHPMQRLLQGDVGSGKTAVFLAAAICVLQAGMQVALMAPTEILAEQHFKGAHKLMSPLGVEVRLLTAQTKTTERKKILEDLQNGISLLVIGTHALIEADVQFSKLAFVIVDEQHRFGVQQRQRLKEKSMIPHFLMVTATPIPRTLAMTAYGDLDVSIIREKPPGRTPVQTRLIKESQRGALLNFLWEQIQKGRQAYMIYPLVAESEKMPLKDVMTAYQNYQKSFPNIKWGLLHGQMNAVEKHQIMEDFRQLKIQVLLSTTVVEVGVDVPNANLIVIEHAERFGLSQLHQLRGRVGRGQHKGFCALLASELVSADSWERLQKLESTTDGFELAEWDLEWRGAGEILGQRQSGLNGFKMANLLRDSELLKEARAAAEELLQKDSQFKLSIHKKVKSRLDQLLKTNA